MKRNILFLIATLLVALSSCNTEEKMNGTGLLRIGVSTNTSVVTKAGEDVEITNIRLIVKNTTAGNAGSEWSKEYDISPNQENTEIELAPGTYQLTAIAGGDDTENGFMPCYKGTATATVIAGQRTAAKIECTLTTVKVSVEYASSLISAYGETEFKTEIAGLSFSKNETRAGYITPGSLSVNFMFKDQSGNWQTIQLSDIAKAQAREYYKIKISVENTGDGSSEGAANITIQVGEENPENVTVDVVLPKAVVTTLAATEVEYTTAILNGTYVSPSNKQPVSPTFTYRVKGTETWQSISATLDGTNKYTASLSGLEKSTEYEFSFLGKGEVLTFTTKESYTTLDERAVGLNSVQVYGVLNENVSEDEIFEYKLASGSESELWTPADARLCEGEMNKYTATLPGLSAGQTYQYRFMKSKVIQTCTTYSSISVKSVTAGADYAKVKWTIEPMPNEGDKVIVDYKIKKSGSSDWEATKTVTIPFVKEGDEDVKILNLDQNGAYCIDDEVMVFTTLKNANFDEWNSSTVKGIMGGNKTVWFPGSSQEASSKKSFWDSGNMGAATMGINPTSGESSDVHTISGKSAKLKSQYVGVKILNVGKFAAGNIYIGQYMQTYSDKMPYGARIRFGQEFTSRPTKLKGWYKYNRGTSIDYGDHNKVELDASGGDKCAIYIALTNHEGLESDGVKTAFEIDNRGTEDPSKFIYQSTVDLSEKNKNVIAYGTISDDESKGLDKNWKSFEINLNYRMNIEKQDVTYIMIVASASKYGDFFTGSSESTMYIDDFELVYDFTLPPYKN